MNITTANNVSNNERAFRGVIGFSLLTTLIAASVIASPIAIFITSMIAVYFVMTAIIGIDPVYVAMNSFSKASTTTHHHLATR